MPVLDCFDWDQVQMLRCAVDAYRRDIDSKIAAAPDQFVRAEMVGITFALDDIRKELTTALRRSSKLDPWVARKARYDALQEADPESPAWVALTAEARHERLLNQECLKHGIVCCTHCQGMAA
jgi:hypothetical protein